MTRRILIIGLLFTVQCFGQTLRKNSLLIAEFQKNYKGLGNYTHLVSYKFINGKLSSKDTILSAPSVKFIDRKPPSRFTILSTPTNYQESYVGYRGQNFIYQNRYVISAFGNVIDVQTKSLVMEESDNLIETRGDSIIFRRDNIFTGIGYLICDLHNRTYGFVEDTNFLKVKGINSPNHKMGIGIDQSKLPYKIVLYNHKNEEEVIVSNCGNGTLLFKHASTFSNIPLFWINNFNFLYATYSYYSGHSSDNINARVIIHEYNVERKSSEVITIIDSVPPAVTNSYFSIDPDDKIIFDCAKGEFLIDTKNKLSVLINWSSVNNDFSIENNINEEYGRIITFQDKEIGRVWCRYSNAKTTSGFIAVEYGEVGSNLEYPKGVRVWNNITNEWIDIEIPWVSNLIGWIEN
ncbi:MAG: hypothetical protein J0M05_12385 [Candidatus Kapabacteria bacterium]|nr:hypothetical protein [Candidatus Kapabacteria bacterium]